MYQSRTIIVALLLSMTFAVPSKAQQDGKAILQIVKQLGDESYSVRESTHFTLLADDTLTVERMFGMYALCETPEQRQRLREVAIHHALRDVVTAIGKRERHEAEVVGGALGIRTDAMTPSELPELETSAIRVTKRLPGFPAYETLRQDDLIIAVDGELLPALEDYNQLIDEFGQRIIGFQMGNRINMTVIRGGKRVDVEVELASYAALEDIYPRGSNLNMKQEYESKLAELLNKMQELSPPPPGRLAVRWEE